MRRIGAFCNILLGLACARGALSYELGVAYSPRGFEGSDTGQDVVDFYSNHAAYGRIIARHLRWRDSVESAGQIPEAAQVHQAAASQYGFIPVVGFGWEIDGVPDLTSQSDPVTNTWANAESRSEYLQMVVAYAAQYHPAYLFLGNETNGYWLSAPADWANWISEHKACYDAIKAVSPATTVFTTFQLERMKGLGVKNGWNNPSHWGIIADYGGKLDAVGFTTYPYFQYETPQDIPQAYYSEIRDYWTGPVVFSEIGWLADPAVPYTGSEQEQADFITVFFERTAALPLAYVVYLFLHDYDALPPAFRKIGLRENDGTARLADPVWRSRVGAGAGGGGDGGGSGNGGRGGGGDFVRPSAGGIAPLAVLVGAAAWIVLAALTAQRRGGP